MSAEHNEGHAESCACLYPGDRQCNCHMAYGFATAEEMDEADQVERMSARNLLEQREAAVAELIEAHKRIAALDPETDSKDGFNEWGEAECFGKAQEISRAALARIGGAS